MLGRFATCWLLWASALSTGGNGIAVLVLHFEGEVESRFGESGTGGVLQPLTRLPPGTQLNLPPGSSARMLCGNNRIVELTGPRQWMADGKTCSGRQLATHVFERLMESASPISVTAAGKAAVKTRDPNAGSAVWVLAPRASVRQDRPRLVWSAPLSTSYFQWKLSAGTRVLARKAVKASSLCRAAGDNRSVCAMDFPSLADPLTPGRLTTLEITVLGPDLKPSTLKGQASFVLLGREKASALNERAASIEDAPLPSSAKCLAKARLLEVEGALGEALESLLECSGEADPALLDRPLARLYLTAELARAALPHLKSLAARSSDHCERAGIDLGLGRAHLLLGEHQRADSLLRSSVSTLQQCGLETALGQKWIEVNEKHLRAP